MALETLANYLTTPKMILIRTSKEHQMTRTAIHASARIAQASFAFGCVTSGIDIAYRLLQILTGGSIVLQGIQIMVQVVKMGIYHDLAQIASNVASIFKSQVLIQYAKEYAGEDPYGKLAIQFAEGCEKKFTLPESTLRKLNNGKRITAAITYDTLGAYNFNPQIEKFLDR